MNTIANDIRQILQQARNKAYTAINSAMTEAYWHIGRRIVQEYERLLMIPDKKAAFES